MLNFLIWCLCGACEKFNAQTGEFIAQSGDLSLNLRIYRSKSTIYRSNTSHLQANLARFISV